MLPTRLLVLCAAVPTLVAVGAVVDPSLMSAALVVDAGVVVIALVDAFLSRGKPVLLRRETPSVLSLGRANDLFFEVRSRARRGLALQIGDDLFPASTSGDLPLRVKVPARGSLRLRYRVRPTARGAHTLGDCHVRLRSVLGLWWRQYRVETPGRVRVYPDVASIREFEMLARRDNLHHGRRAIRQRGGEQEFETLRDYQHDDEFRTIDWKATARKRRIIARQYQIERNQNVMFAIDAGRLATTEVAGLSLFDHALNATIMLSHVATRGGDRVGALTFRERVLSFAAPGVGANATRRILETTFDVHPRLLHSDYEPVQREIGFRLRRRSLIVLFTHVFDDASAKELHRFVRSLRPRHLPLCVLLRDTEVEALAEPDPEVAKDADLFRAAAAAELLAWRRKLVQSLESQGVLVLETTAQDLSAALVDRYLSVKARGLL